jgi:hypothetical protein
MQKLMSETMVHATSLNDVPFDLVRQRLKENTYASIRGIFSPKEIFDARDKMRHLFDEKNDRKHDPNDSEAIRKNFQKLQIGGTRGVNACARFLRMFYNPTFADDVYGMHDIFNRLITFRNLLYSLPADFTIGKTEMGMWTASRIMQYPTGGGFMSPHVDTGTRTVSEEMGLEQYIQLILIMSKKGADFMEGGAYINDENGERYFFEDECDLGDIVIYDGRVVHGVEEIDPMEPLNMSALNGRIVALVSLFKHFSKEDGRDEYKTLMKNHVNHE